MVRFRWIGRSVGGVENLRAVVAARDAGTGSGEHRTGRGAESTTAQEKSVHQRVERLVAGQRVRCTVGVNLHFGRRRVELLAVHAHSQLVAAHVGCLKAGDDKICGERVQPFAVEIPAEIGGAEVGEGDGEFHRFVQLHRTVGGDAQNDRRRHADLIDAPPQNNCAGRAEVSVHGNFVTMTGGRTELDPAAMPESFRVVLARHELELIKRRVARISETVGGKHGVEITAARLKPHDAIRRRDPRNPHRMAAPLTAVKRFTRIDGSTTVIGCEIARGTRERHAIGEMILQRLGHCDSAQAKPGAGQAQKTERASPLPSPGCTR